VEISAVIITRNEEKRLEPALESLAGAVSEIIVVDCSSSDDTRKIARKFTPNVYEHKWTDFAAQKNYATGLASKSWILSLDADERLSPDLRLELAAMRDIEPSCAAFYVPFKNWYLGKWINHSGWRPDLRLRLFRKDKGLWVGDFVHERLKVEGKVDKLKGHIHHFPFAGIDEQVSRINEFSRLEAQKFYAAGKKARLWHVCFQPFQRFFSTYFLKLGIFDGFPGFVIAGLAGYEVFLRYIKLRDIWKKGERIEPVSR